MFHYLPSHLPLRDKNRQWIGKAVGLAERWQLPEALCSQAEFRHADLSAETAEDLVTHSGKSRTQEPRQFLFFLASNLKNH